MRTALRAVRVGCKVAPIAVVVAVLALLVASRGAYWEIIPLRLLVPGVAVWGGLMGISDPVRRWDRFDIISTILTDGALVLGGVLAFFIPECAWRQSCR